MFRYNGPAVISLEGRESLEFRSNGNGMLYDVGGPNSQISIRDFRQASMEAARQALAGVRVEAFADVFNDLAWVEVEDSAEQTRIVIREYHSQEGTPITLWVGVMEDRLMAFRRSFWEQVKFLDPQRVAFAVLLDD